MATCLRCEGCHVANGREPWEAEGMLAPLPVLGCEMSLRLCFLCSHSPHCTDQETEAPRVTLYLWPTAD